MKLTKRLLSTFVLICLLCSTYAQSTVTVVEYVPAPGQFINTLPVTDANDDSISILAKAQTLIDRKSVVTLGGYGGYITLYYADGIINQPNQYDFRVLGNAFANSSEPGIIYLSKDDNHNGLPDDTWFEIAGSEWSNNATIHNYHIIYYKPSSELENQSGVIDNYIFWKDSEGESGYLSRNSFHQQSYWPNFFNKDSLYFNGTRLPDNSIDTNGDGTYITNQSFDWGYADNYSNTEEGSKIKMEWAIDSNGNPVNLDTIHFVKVRTGIHSNYSLIGEISTEVGGLELVSGHTATIEIQDETLNIEWIEPWLTLDSECDLTLFIYTPSGKIVEQCNLPMGYHKQDFSHLQNGMYIIQIISKRGRIVKKIIKNQ